MCRTAPWVTPATDVPMLAAGAHVLALSAGSQASSLSHIE